MPLMSLYCLHAFLFVDFLETPFTCFPCAAKMVIKSPYPDVETPNVDVWNLLFENPTISPRNRVPNDKGIFYSFAEPMSIADVNDSDYYRSNQGTAIHVWSVADLDTTSRSESSCATALAEGRLFGNLCSQLSRIHHCYGRWHCRR
jgi:hypothetical protein